MSNLEAAIKLAKDLGLNPQEPDDGAILAEEFGMNGEPPAEVRDLEVIEAEILFYKRQAGESILEIGKRLNEAKAQLSHGEWLPWLREKVDISERSAQNFMRLAREYSKSAEIADLGASKALALLALSDSERREFVAENHVVDGVEKSVADMTNKELKQALSERDQARRETEEAKAETEAAEAARKKMASDMAHLKELAQRANEAEAQKQKELDGLRAELQDLKNRPVEVAVQEPDPAAVQQAVDKALTEERAKMEAATAEAVKKAEGALEKAKQEARKLREKVKAAEEKVASAASDEKAKAEAAVKETEDLRRELAMADPATAEFRALFGQLAQLSASLVEMLGKVPEGNREKLANGLHAIGNQLLSAEVSK